MLYEFFRYVIVCLIALAISSWLQSRKKKEHDYYILKMYGLIDPQLLGPFEFNECQEKLEAYREDPDQSQNSFTEVRITKGAEIDV